MTHVQVDVPQLSIPFEILDGGHVREVEQDALDEIAMSVESVLRYRIGDREELPEFGTPELAFKADEEVFDAVAEHVARWEPRVQLLIEHRPSRWDDLVQDYVLTMEVTPDD